MDSPIPRVRFRQPENQALEFEILPLRRLFTRNVRLSCPLDHPHRVDFYQILYITGGRGKHYVDLTPHAYAGGSLIFVSKGQVQAFDPELGAQGFLILFTEDFLTRNMVHSDVLSVSRLYNYHLYPPVLSPPEAEARDFDGLIREIAREYNGPERFAGEEILRTLLRLLLLKAERLRQASAPPEKNAEWILRFNDFRRLLSALHTETRNADRYADMMQISYNHLNRIVKAVTGRTAKAFIDGFVVLEIKRHLAVSDISVKELAYLMGFDEPTNFVKYIKKHSGISPARFRKTLTE